MVLTDWIPRWPFARGPVRKRRRLGEGMSRLRTLLSRQVEVLEVRGLLTAGGLDPTFGLGGIVVTNIADEVANVAINDSALQADGKIVVVGAVREHFLETLNTDVLVARYTADGVLDTTFDGDGIARIAVGVGFESGRAVAVLPNGKILIAGDVGATKNDSNTDLLLIRLNADGSLDTSFDGDGFVTTHVLGDNNAYDMAVLPDGRIVVGGSLSDTQFLAVRYNPDGSLDTSFAGDGIVETSFTGLGYSEAEAYSLAVQSDGKLILAGRANSVRMAVARYNMDGSLDTTFDGDGLAAVATSTSEGYATSVAVAPDGRIVLGGLSSIGSPRVQLVRLLANGSLDTSFDGDGRLVLSSPPVESGLTSRGFVQNVAVQPDGKVLFSGLFSLSSYWSPDNFLQEDATAVGRLNVDGSLDTTFSGDGWATSLADENYNQGVLRPIVLQPDGKIVVGGTSFAPGIGLVRLNADGVLDTTFADDGRVGTSHAGTYVFLPTNERANGVTIQSDGRVVVAGTTDTFTALGTTGYEGYLSDRTNGFVVRYDASGMLDTSFDGLGPSAQFSLDGNGRVVLGSLDRDDFHDVISLNNRDVVTAASFDNQGLFSNERFFFDGQADQIDYLTAGGLFTSANALVSQSDGKIVSVGSRRGMNSPFPGEAIVARSLGLSGGTYDGRGDAAFGTLGVVAVPLSSGLEAFEAVAIQADGKIIAAGWAESGTNKQFVVVRLNGTGTLDTSFSGDGLVTLSFGGTDERAQGVVIQSDGKIVVGGYSATGSSASFVMARLLNDGTLDNSFDGDGLVTTSFSGVAAFARGLVLQADGKLVLGGDAGNAFALARYQSNGSLDSTFDGDGRVATVLAANTIAHHGADLVLRSDGSLMLAGGVTYFDGRTDIAVARYLGDAAVQAPAITHVSDDRGRHDRDAITNDQTLMIFGQAVPNRTIEVFREGLALGTTTSDATGQWSFDSTVTVLAEGQYRFASRVIGASVSSLSEPYLVTIDLTPPASTTTRITDTGTSSTDLVTRSISRFDGYAEVDSSVELWLDGVQLPIGNYANDLIAVAYRTFNNYWRFTRDPDVSLSLGTHQVTTRVTDLAGNSTSSNPLSFVVVSSATAPVSLASPGSVLEGSATAPFTVRLNSASDQQITVGLTWSGGATAGQDFTAASSQVVAPGVTVAPVNVLLDDTIYEGDETLTVEITTVSFGGAEQGTQLATVTIAENDAPTLSDITDLTTPVGAATAAIPFVLGNFVTGIDVPVTATSSNTLLVPSGNIVFSGSGANRSLTITPAAGRSGQATVSVTAGHGAATVTDTFVLTVGVEANRPTITAIADQSTSEDVPLAPVSFTIGDDDTAVGSLSVTASSSNTTLVPNANIVLGGSGASRTIAMTPAANLFGTTTITITLTDASGMSVSDSFDLQVDPVNDAPSLSSITNRTTNEDAPTSAIAITVSDIDNTAASLTLSAVSSDTSLVPNGSFTFSGSSANRTLIVTPAADQNGAATITVTVSDGSLTSSRSFNLTVNPLNDPPTISDVADQATSEDTATSAISISIGDIDSSIAGLIVTATSSNIALIPNGNLVLSGTGANRSIVVTPAANQTGSATITLTVSDGTLTATDTFLITVNAINDAPTISDITGQSTNEDTASSAIAFSVGDLESAASTLIVSAVSANTTLVPNANIVFSGSGASRTLVVTPAPNQFGTTTITVTVSDGATTSSDSFVLTVNAVNDAPSLSDISNQTTNEDTATSAISFSVSDLETAADSLTVTATSSNTTLVPNGNVTFGGSGANRTVTVTPVANQFGTTTITVTVSDGTLTASDTFLVTVNAINDAPTIGNVADQTTNEDVTSSAISFTISDLETAAGSLTVTATSSNASLIPNANLSLGGSGANRTLTVTPAANQSGTATITLTVSDGSLSATDTFVVTVNAVNDPPTISDIANQATNEDAATSAIAFTVGDLDTAVGSLTVTATSSNTSLVPNGNVTFGGSGANRTLTIAPAANQSGTTTITVTVRDGVLTSTDTFVLTVNAVNDAPTISDVSGQSTDEDTPSSAISFTIGDLDTTSGSLTVTATSSNGTLIPNANLSLGGSGANRTVIVTPAANQSGTTTITLTVSDGNLTATDTFLVTVNAVNDAPTINDIANQATNEDTTTSAIAFSVGDLDTSVASLTVTASSSNTSLVPNENVTIGGSGANRTLTITPAANQSGTTTITVTVSDGLLTSSDTFVLTVNAVNDVPTISTISSQSTDEDSPTSAISFTIGDLETISDSLTVTATSSNGTLIPNANLSLGGSGANRTLIVTPAANRVGSANITVTVSDGSASASTVFALTINPLNDAPTLSDIADQTTNEDTATSAISFNIGDLETSPSSLTVTVSSSDTTLVPNGNLLLGGSGANRTLVATPAANLFGTTTITVSVSDGLLTVTDTFLLTVNSVNDLPTISELANQTIDRNGTTDLLNFTIGDSETLAADLTVSASSSNSLLAPNGSLLLGGSGANRTIQITPAAGQFGTATITITVSDGSLSASRVFQLTVNENNHAPTINDLVNQTTDEDLLISGLDILVGDEDSPAGDLIVSATSSDTTLIPHANVVVTGSGAGRLLSLTPAANQWGTATITVTVSDGQLTRSDTFLLTVNSINDGPAISAIADQSVSEGSVRSIAFTISDVESAAANLTVTASSSNPALVPNSSLVLGGSGANRSIQATPTADQTGTTTITISASDGLITTTREFLLTVTPVNDLPTLSSFTAKTTTEDRPTASIPFTIGDKETAANDLTVTATSSNTSLVPNGSWTFGGADANRTLVVIPAANASGTATITVSVNDGADTVSKSFVLTVTGVNDTPTVSDTPSQTTNEDTPLVAIPITVGDAEIAAGSLVVTVTSSNTILVPANKLTLGGSGANRTLTIAPAANLSGSTTITVKVSDGVLNSTDTFVVTVTPVNDAPTITDITNKSTKEDTATTAIPFTIGDIDSSLSNLVVSATSSNSALVPNANLLLTGTSASRSLKITPAANQFGSTTVSVTVSDGVSTKTDSFVLTVTAVNDAPTISNIPNQSIARNTATNAIPFTIGDIDSAVSVLRLTVTSSNTTLVPTANIVFTGTGTDRTLKITPALNRTGTATITVRVTDGLLSVTKTFVITVN